MAFTLPPLPYPADALAPHMSAETFSYHHGKHHNAYVTNLNNLVAADASLQGKSLEELILLSAKDDARAGVFNNAAQVWNHTFFWHCMKPSGGGRPTGALLARIEADFGGFDAFKAAFTQAATTQFGSGWAWLVLDGGSLKVTKTSNAGTPMTSGQVALLTIDVWEHAYYIDHRNARPAFINAFLDHLVDWDFVAKNLASAQG